VNVASPDTGYSNGGPTPLSAMFFGIRTTTSFTSAVIDQVFGRISLGDFEIGSAMAVGAPEVSSAWLMGMGFAGMGIIGVVRKRRRGRQAG
jgi:hypothetical protein